MPLFMAVKTTDSLGSDAILVISASDGLVGTLRVSGNSGDSSGIAVTVFNAEGSYIPRMRPFSFNRPEIKNPQTKQTEALNISYM